MRLPGVKTLRARVGDLRVAKNTRAAACVDYLLAHRSYLAPFEDYEHFGLSDDLPASETLQTCERHMSMLHRAVVTILWESEFYIGPSVIADLLFRSVAHGTTADPIHDVLAFVRDRGLHTPGFVVYPLHSLGIIGAPVLRAFAAAELELHVPSQHLILTPQTNDPGRTVDFLSRAARTLGITRSVPQELVRHWMRSRQTSWLTRNPLAAVRLPSRPGCYYENQFFLVTKLEVAMCHLAMLATLQHGDQPPATPWSSSRLNNWETFDLRHYLLFYPSATSKSVLAGDCVPMNLQRTTLAEMSDLSIEIDPKHWRRKKILETRLASALRKVERGYVRHSISRSNTLEARVYRKLFRSLQYFRQSLRRSDDHTRGIVNLCVAFEVLLVDHYVPRVAEKLKTRLGLALRGVSGTRKLQEATSGLYAGRSQTLHSGSTKATVDIPRAQRTFVFAFLGVVERLKNLPRRSGQPIGDILGDV